MFTLYMTEEEIVTEARKDFWDLKYKIDTAHRKFTKPHIEAYKNNNHVHLVHNTIQMNKYVTKQNNTWYTLHYLWNIAKSGRYPSMTITYTKIPLNKGVCYLIFRNHETLYLEKYTAHFLQRYNERYLLPRNLKPAVNMPLPIYYILNNMNSTNYAEYHFRYLTENGQKKYSDTNNKGLVLSDQGISIVEGRDMATCKTYITFLDAENLTCFQKNIYEEEKFWKLFHKYSQTLDEMESYILAKQICSEPNALKYAEGHLRRISYRIDFPKLFKMVKECLEELPEKLKKGEEEIADYERSKALWEQNKTRFSPMQLPDIPNPIQDIFKLLYEKIIQQKH